MLGRHWSLLLLLSAVVSLYGVGLCMPGGPGGNTTPGPGGTRPTHPPPTEENPESSAPHGGGPPVPGQQMRPGDRPGGGPGMSSGSGMDDIPKPHHPPPPGPGDGAPRPSPPPMPGSGAHPDSTPGGPPPPPRPEMSSGSGMDDTPKPHHPGPGDGAPRPSPPPMPGSGAPHDSTPGGPPPPPRPEMSSGSGMDDTPKPHHPGPGDGAPRPSPPPMPGSGAPPKPPGPPDSTPGRPGKPERPEGPSQPDTNTTVVETTVNQNYSLHMYGGDIALTSEQQATLEATSNQISPFAIQNAVVRSEQFLWENGIVYYIFDNSLSEYARDAILEAMNAYMERTCITFQERTNQADYVRFFSGDGCWSYIGRVSGAQDISIGRGCEYKGIVMHEIFHALGRWHEQSRPDRDLFIRVNDDNIAYGTESNFEVVSTSFATSQAIAYDFGSLMHYDAYAFTSNGRPTIVPLDSSVSLKSLGQRDGLSDSDLQHVLTLYCGGNSGGSWSGWSEWSTCSQSCNGGSRTRTRECTGGSDCEGSNIDKEQCNTESCAVEVSWSGWSSWSQCTASCGGGRRTRRRTCVGGNTCVGRQTEYADCNTDSCPEGSSWAEWGSWSGCSTTCQGGTRLRRRQCSNGNNCTGSNVEVQYCNSDIPCNGSVTVGEWSEWSECSHPCGIGTQFRTRGCSDGVCETESQSCNTHDCNPEPTLRGVQHMGCYWVPPIYSSNLVFLEGTTEDLSDNPWEREDPVSKCGTAAQLYNFNVFALAVGFCISGTSDLRQYQSLESDFCEGGTGGYYSRWMAMDVYVISDAQSFRDSTSTASPSTASPSTASSSTASPSTASPSTASPTTASPSTASPSTASPSTASPTTASPTTGSDPPTSPETPGVEGRRGGSAAPFPSLQLSLFVIVIVVLSL